MSSSRKAKHLRKTSFLAETALTDKEIELIWNEIELRGWRSQDFYHEFKNQNPHLCTATNWHANIEKVISKSSTRRIPAHTHHRIAIDKAFGWTNDKLNLYRQGSVASRNVGSGTIRERGSLCATDSTGKWHKTVLPTPEELDVYAQSFYPPLSPDDLTCTYSEQGRFIPSEIERLSQLYLPKRLEELKTANRLVDQNKKYSLQSLTFSRPQQSDGKRVVRPTLKFEPSDYFLYLCQNAVLNKPLIETEQGFVSIRERFGLDFSDFDWHDLPRLPIHCPFGTCTMVITSDRKLIIPLRGGYVGIRGSHDSDDFHQASLSCAEGMLRPEDAEKRDGGKPSPFLTVYRALGEELNLQSNEQYDPMNVKLLAFGFDKQRAQPIGIFLIRLDSLTFDQAFKLWERAPHRMENKTIIPVPEEPDAIEGLMKGEMTLQDHRKVILFSNHQQFGVSIVSRYLFGNEVNH